MLDFLMKEPSEFTFEEMRVLTGINDMVRLRGYLMTALRRMRKRSVWYKSMRGIGYRRLVEDEKNGVQSGGLDKVKRHVGRLDNDQDLITFDRLSHDGKLTFTINTSRIGLLKHAASLKTKRQVTREVGNGALPVREKKKA